MIKFTVSADPVAKARPRVNRNGRVWTPKKSKDFEGAVCRSAIEAHPGPELNGPLCLMVRLVKKRPKAMSASKHGAGLVAAITKPDIDNYLKAVMDGVTKAGLWKDDAQVVSVSAAKYYAEIDGEPRVEVRIWEAE